MFKELGAVMNLLGNKGKLQEEVAKFQQTVAQISSEGTAGGGMVTVKVTGKMELASCRITEEAAKLDREMLEDLVVAATNQALAKVREQVSAETAKMAGNLGLPAGMLGSIPGLG